MYLSNAKHSICITSDLHKSDALLGALKGKLINTIIIDDLTASKILYLDKYK
ncbi:MAG: sugar-binding domain-containing protein [Terrisporobacter sp.]